MSETGEPGVALSAAPVDALRYDGQSDDPSESTGLLLAMIPPGARVLDVGCGTGSVSRFIRDLRGAEVLGLEPNAERARVAADRGIPVIHGVYSDEIVARHGTFDVVVYADVLEHLVDPADELRRVRTALRTGGHVVASIPNVAHWSVRLGLLAGQFEYQAKGIMDATHLRWFTRASAERLFATSGYHVDDYRASAGTWLHAYHAWPPMRWVPERPRSGVVRRLARWMPRLFGCQHVIRASVAADGVNR